MSLQGSLETFSLADVLVLLASTKKTGQLRVAGSARDGKVWVDDGQIVQSTIGGKDVSAVDAVFDLLRLTSGSFTFEGDDAAPQPGTPQVVDLVLADAQARLAEWRAIEAVVPSLDAVIDMAPEAPGNAVTVDADQWKLLVAVAGGRSVQELMDRTDRSEYEACKAVKELVDAQFVTVQVSGKLAARPAKEARVETPEPPAAPTEEPAEEAGPRARRLRSNTSVLGEGPTPDVPQPPKPPRQAAEPAGTKVDDRKPEVAAAIAASKSQATSEAQSEAQALVAQLAALGIEDEERVAEQVAAHLAEGGELPAVEGDEPINRGLLLKFLSSVRN